MKKSIRKSLLACAVLAGVLGGIVTAEAAQVNILVGPKDLSNIFIGKEITFGQQRGYVQNQSLGILEVSPTWQIIDSGGDSITLLAKESWGRNRISDTNAYSGTGNPGATVQHYQYREVLKYLEENKKDFFSAEELSLLRVQQITEKWSRLNESGSSEYESVFSLPSKESLNNLTPDQKKRGVSYWLDNDKFFNAKGHDKYGYQVTNLWFDQGFIDTNGNYQEVNGKENKDFYPLLKINMGTSFAYLGDRSTPGQSFRSQTADSSSPLHVAFRSTQTEKDVQLKALEISADKIKFTADGLATGTGQGLGGILADNDDNYLSYARLADTSGNSKAEDVTITNGDNKFLDNAQFAPGNYTVYLFNEKLSTDSVSDYVGNFYKLPQVSVNNRGIITGIPLSGNWSFRDLTIGKNVNFELTSYNYAGGEEHGAWRDVLCDGVTVTNSLNWANVLDAEGSITLSGSFSVINGTLTLVRPTNVPKNTRPNEYIVGWNDMIYNGNGGKTATLHVNGDMHGLIVNGGTFTAEKNLKLSDYLKINNGATVEVKGKLDVALAGEINGKLQTDKELELDGFWHVYEDRKIIAPRIYVADTLKLEQNAVIDGRCYVLNRGKLQVVSNCFINGLTLDSNSTLQVDGNNIQEKPAITYTTSIRVADNAKLSIDNQKTGVNYKIAEKRTAPMLMMANGFGSSNSTPDWTDMVWQGYGLIVDKDNSVFNDSGWSVTFEKDPELHEYSDIPNIVTGMADRADSIPWLEQLTNEFLAYSDKGLYLEALNNSANTYANLNSLANVQTGLRTMSSLVNDSIQENVGLRHEGKHDKQVWASVIHNKEKIEGRKTGHLEQDSTLQYNGIVVGADLWNGKHGFGGVVLSYGSGNFHSYQMATEVKNEADYYGISIYNRQDVGKFRFLYDGGFTYGKNDVTLATAWKEEITAKPKAWSYNVGIRAEEPIKLSQATELTPFAGLRYTFIKTKDYRDNYGDEFSADNQHLVNLPVGLTLKGTYQTKEGWELGGTLTGGYNWNLGNRNSTQRIGYAIFSDSMDFDTVDRGEYFIRAALQAKNKNMIFELGYRYSKGNTSRDNRWNVNANFTF